MASLVDAYRRKVTDLRISVTKRCNFKCVYCHDEGLGPVAPPSAAHDDELTPAEVERFVKIAQEFHIRSIKFTGGEPLVRRDMEEIVDRTVRHIADVSMTTNGSMLADRAAGLRAAGLKRVNISADTLDPTAFAEIRRGHIEPVLRGIDAALAEGLKPVKINMVVMAATRPHLRPMLDHIQKHDGLKLQLIQFMPELVGHRDWAVDIAEVKRELESEADRVIVREMHHRRIYCFNGSEVEVVDPVDNPEFCFNCHRIRVTHDGRLKGCLNRDDDLTATRGLDDDALRAAFRRTAAQRVPYYGVYHRSMDV